MNNKFVLSLTATGSEIKEKRASILGSSTRSAQETIVNELQNQLNQNELDIENLTDIAPGNTYSLRPGGKGFEPVKWAVDLQALKISQWQLSIELRIAKETLSEWFDELLIEESK